MDERLLGDTIRAARMRKGYTIDQLAESLDIASVHLSNIEGSRRKPSVPLLFRLMELLDFSVDALVFPEREQSKVLHIDHLTDAQAEALERFLDTLK